MGVSILAGCKYCKTGMVECPECSGRGFKTCKSCDGTGELGDYGKCSICYGTGLVNCFFCNGKRLVYCEKCGGSGIE